MAFKSHRAQLHSAWAPPSFQLPVRAQDGAQSWNLELAFLVTSQKAMLITNCYRGPSSANHLSLEQAEVKEFHQTLLDEAGIDLFQAL